MSIDEVKVMHPISLNEATFIHRNPKATIMSVRLFLSCR